MTYSQAKRRLEGDCGFGVIFTVAMGRAAGAAMNAILKEAPDAPLLNVLLVQSDSGLPGSGLWAISQVVIRAFDGHGRPDA